MKVNNPLQRGVYKITEYNGRPVYYSSAQDSNHILVGRKSGIVGHAFYIVGILNKKEIENLIKLRKCKISLI